MIFDNLTEREMYLWELYNKENKDIEEITRMLGISQMQVERLIKK